MKLETARLLLAPLSETDAGEVHALWTSPGVRRFLWDGEAIPPEKTRELLRHNQRLFQRRSLGIWGARSREGRELVGFAGFWHFRDPPRLEFLFGVRDDCRGRGYAPEAGRAVIGHAFGRLGMDEIAASTDAGNRASRRALEKLGMTLEGRRVVDGLDTLFYRLVRPPTPASDS